MTNNYRVVLGYLKKVASRFRVFQLSPHGWLMFDYKASSYKDLEDHFGASLYKDSSNNMYALGYGLEEKAHWVYGDQRVALVCVIPQVGGYRSAVGEPHWFVDVNNAKNASNKGAIEYFGLKPVVQD